MPPRDGDMSWFRPFLLRVLVVAIVVLLATLLVLGLHVVLLVFAGLLFGVLLGRLTDYLHHYLKLPRLLALLIVVLAFLAVFGGLTAVITPQAVSQGTQLIKKMDVSSGKITQWANSLELTSGDIVKNVPVHTALQKTLYTGIELVSGIVVIFFVGIFFAADPGIYQRGIKWLFPRSRRHRVGELMERLKDAMWRWLIGRAIIMLTTGLFVGIGLWAVGAPLPFALGFIAGVLAFVPTLGPVVAMIPALLVAIPLGWQMVASVSVIYVIIQAAEANLLTPVIQQFQVSVPPVLLLGAQLLMWIISGGLGMAMATPLCAVGLVIVKELYVKDVLGDDADGDDGPDGESKS